MSSSIVRNSPYSDLPEVPQGAHIHIVGIGGSGMSAIARVLLERGDYRVSGSDLDLSAVGRTLAGLGATVHDGHDAAHVGDADLVFVSSAIPGDNVEVQAAVARGIPVVKRPEVLAWLTGPFLTVGVAGTAGKTTTAAMAAHVLLRTGMDPSFIAGGVVAGLGTNARAGSGPFVVEADEYDHTFLALTPTVAVVTNVAWDHPDCYPTYEDMRAAFAAYLQRVPPAGCVVICDDDPGAIELLANLAPGRRLIRYGVGPECDVRAVDRREKGLGQEFDLVVAGKREGRVALAVPGLHNARNALAALSIAWELRAPLDAAREALASFRGVARRFEIKGEAAGVTVIDDYAHHPAKVRATLESARGLFPRRTIWAVFQPHTYSRTQALLEEYRRSFSDADHVLVTPIYAARERDDGRTSSQALVRGAGHSDMRYVPGLQAAVDELARRVQDGDIILVMGAGDSYRVGDSVLSALQERKR